MKTSEFRKWLEDNGWNFTETLNYIQILDLMKVYTTTQAVKFEKFTYGSDSSFALLKVISEYCSTLLENRIDEKIYQIIFIKDGKAYFTESETKELLYDTKGNIERGTFFKKEIK